MDYQIKSLKRDLKKNCCEFFQIFKNHPIKERCESAIDTISIIKVIFPHNLNQLRNQLFALITQLSIDMSNKASLKIEDSYNKLAIQLSNSIFISLNIQIIQSQPCIHECLTAKLSLPNTIIFTITYIFTSIISIIQSFSLGWDLLIKHLLDRLNLAHYTNLFAKSFLYSLISEDKTNDYNLPIDPSNYSKIPHFLFSDLRNFKFFIKASKIYQHFKVSTNPQKPNEKIFNLIMTQTSDPNCLNNENFHTPEYNIGVEGFYRLDSLVLIGTHPSCDILLPASDQNLENIAFAIFYNGSNYYILDCGKKTYLSKKIQAEIEYKVFEGMVISLADSTLMHLAQKIYFDSGEEFGSELIYEFLDGELAGFGKQFKRLVTNQRDGSKKKLFFLGRGLVEESADICLRQGGKISAKHLYFKYQDCDWVVFDLNSKNGSYILLKNKSQFDEKSFSSCQIILKSINSYECFLVAGYTFLFRSLNK